METPGRPANSTRPHTTNHDQDQLRDIRNPVGGFRLSGARAFDPAMADYRACRDEQVLPMYEFTTQLATLEPPPPELHVLLAAMSGNQLAMDGFARVNAGVTSPAEFFRAENVELIMSQSGVNAMQTA